MHSGPAFCVLRACVPHGTSPLSCLAFCGWERLLYPSDCHPRLCLVQGSSGRVWGTQIRKCRGGSFCHAVTGNWHRFPCVGRRSDRQWCTCWRSSTPSGPLPSAMVLSQGMLLSGTAAGKRSQNISLALAVFSSPVLGDLSQSTSLLPG